MVYNSWKWQTKAESGGLHRYNQQSCSPFQRPGFN